MTVSQFYFDTLQNLQLQTNSSDVVYINTIHQHIVNTNNNDINKDIQSQLCKRKAEDLTGILSTQRGVKDKNQWPDLQPET